MATTPTPPPDAPSNDPSTYILDSPIAGGGGGEQNSSANPDLTSAFVVPKGPAGIGIKGGDGPHDAILKAIVEQEQFYRNVLAPKFDEMNRYMALYMGDRDDDRAEHEKWRAKTHVPYPFSAVETVVAAVCDIINSADPWVQADPIGAEDYENARGIERLCDYTLRRNRWPSKCEELVRASAIQGLTIPKLVWMAKELEMQIHTDKKSVDLFKERVKEAEAAASIPMPTDPEEWHVWKDLVQRTNPGIKIPDIPVSGIRKVVKYRGPWIEQIPLSDLRFDPFIEDFQEQHMVIQRMVRTQGWLKDQCAKGVFDEDQVGVAMGGYNGERFGQWQSEVATMMGFESEPMSDPYYQDGVELFEVWRPNSKFPYCIVLNREAIINIDPSKMPYWHAELPYFPLKNLPMAGSAFGMSELKQGERLFYEMDVLRDLRLDAVTLKVLPIFAKLRNMALSEPQTFLKPGLVIDVDDVNGIQQLLKGGNDGLMEAFRELDEIKRDIDETNGTFGSVRGAPSEVGRVSASSEERRFGQALSRQKLRVVRFEQSLNPMVKQMLALWYQKGDPKVVLNVAGGNALVTMDRNSLLDALEQDFGFRGASRALNGELMSQQLMAFDKQFGQRLTPMEQRFLMKLILETMRQKQVDRIVSETGTAMMQQAQEAQQAQAAQQAQIQAAQHKAEASGVAKQARVAKDTQDINQMAGGSPDAAPGSEGQNAQPPAGAPAQGQG